MIEELLLWVLPKINEMATKIIQANLNQSNLVFLLYLITGRKAACLGLAFFVCELSGYTNGFGLYQKGWHIYLGYLLISSYFVIIQLEKLKASKEYETRIDVAFCSLALLFLFIWAIGDAYLYPKTKTWFYLNYANILVLLHILLISSFYKPTRSLKRLGDKLRRAITESGYNYNCQYLLYTFRHRFAIQNQK